MKNQLYDTEKSELVFTAKKTFGIVQQNVFQKLYKDSSGQWFIHSQTADDKEAIIPMTANTAAQWSLVAGMSAYEVVQHFNLK